MVGFGFRNREPRVKVGCQRSPSNQKRATPLKPKFEFPQPASWPEYTPVFNQIKQTFFMKFVSILKLGKCRVDRVCEVINEAGLSPVSPPLSKLITHKVGCCAQHSMLA